MAAVKSPFCCSSIARLKSWSGEVSCPNIAAQSSITKRDWTNTHRPQNSLESPARLRDNKGFAGPAMKTKPALFLLLLFSILLFVGKAALGQGSIPSGGGAGTETRPDSIQDLGYMGYMANSPGGVAAGAGLWGKVAVDGNPLLWEPITVVVSCATGKTDLTTSAGPDGKFVINRVNLPKAYTLDGDVSRQMAQHYEGCTIRGEAGWVSFDDGYHHRGGSAG